MEFQQTGSLVIVNIDKKNTADHIMKDVRNRGKQLTEILIECGLNSKNESRNLIRGGAIKLNNQKVVDENSVLYYDSEMNKVFLVQFV